MQRAEHYEDDDSSVVTVQMFVPDSDKDRLKKFLLDSWSVGSLVNSKWGVSIGDTVDVETKDGILNIEFRGTVIGFCGVFFRGVFVQVEDMDNNVFDVEPECLTTIQD